MNEAQDIYSLGCTLLQAIFQTMLGHPNQSVLGVAHCYAAKHAHISLSKLSDEKREEMF